jgi:hypothetical protein
MADKRTYVPDGRYPELTVTLSKKPTAQGNQAGRIVSRVKQPGPIAPYIPDDDLVRLHHITFYDLGTRKQEDGSYLDIIPNDIIVPGDGSFDWWEFYHTLMLDGGTDIFKGNNCLKLPFKSQFLYTDAEVLPSDPTKDSYKEVLGQKDTRPYVNELAIIGQPNVNHTKWDGSLPLQMPRDDMGEAIDCYLALHTVFYYNAFYTGSPDPTPPFFHITTTPDPDGADTFFALRGQDKVYLTPIWTSSSTGTTPNHVYFSRRLPVLPNFQPQADALTMMGFNAVSGMLEAQANAALWAAINAYYTAHHFAGSGWAESVASIPVGGSFVDMTIDDMVATLGTVVDGDGNIIGRNGVLGYDLFAHPRTLVAVIVRKPTEIYYIWRNCVYAFDGSDRLPIDPLFFWRKTRIYHP